jgi:hypothetical protein
MFYRLPDLFVLSILPAIPGVKVALRLGLPKAFDFKVWLGWGIRVNG